MIIKNRLKHRLNMEEQQSKRHTDRKKERNIVDIHQRTFSHVVGIKNKLRVSQCCNAMRTMLEFHQYYQVSKDIYEGHAIEHRYYIQLLELTRKYRLHILLCAIDLPAQRGMNQSLCACVWK